VKWKEEQFLLREGLPLCKYLCPLLCLT